MAYSKENCSVASIQKILNKNWPDHIVIGNQPYHTTTLLLKREGDQFLLVKSYDKNNDLFREMIKPGWYPGKDLYENSLFDGMTPSYINYNRQLLSKIVDLLTSVEDIGSHFGIDVSDHIKEVRKMYHKLVTQHVG